MPEAPRLSLDAVSLEFGGVSVLNSITLDVAPGEVLALIGPNGAGKSALLNCISGIYRPAAGSRIAIDGARIDQLPAHRVIRAGVRRTFQGMHLVGELTVLENVLLGLAPRFHLGAFASLALPLRALREERENTKRAEAVLERTGLGGVARERSADLPLGVLRRVDLARALVGAPALLLLDEPASGLSHDERPLIAEMIALARGARADLAVLWIEHDLDLVLSVAERAAVLHHGELIHVGDPRREDERRRIVAAYKGGRPAAAEAA
ncbi:ABC transporter ATP-binding protein [Xanthobacter pseudotagetidis]|uniref:ABC transporter ATP-binding protein n=1 Tax=Xanthobacter pseudotagetidis TaxID=3119911 RepID=UPI0037282C9A